MDRLRSREQTRSQRSIGYHYPYFDWLGWTVRYHETPPPQKKHGLAHLRLVTRGPGSFTGVSGCVACNHRVGATG
jgi:hypothetical protein